MIVLNQDISLAAQTNDWQAFASLINRQYNRLLSLRLRRTGSQGINPKHLRHFIRKITKLLTSIKSHRMALPCHRQRLPRFKFCTKHSLESDPAATHTVI